MDVFAGDIEVWRKDPKAPMEPAVKLDTNEFFPPDPVTNETILITRMQPQWNPVAPNQRLAFVAKATVSNGTEDARFSPVAACAYEYTPDPSKERQAAVKARWLQNVKKIYVTEGLAREQIAALGDKIVKWEDLGPDKQGALDREFRTMEIQRCYLVDEAGEPNDFTFLFESIGVQPVPAIGEAGIAACEALVSKYQDMDGTLPDNVQLLVADTQFPAIDILFQGEGHTLGNLLETYLVSGHVGVEGVVEGKEEPRLTYAAYKVPHPLKAEMVLRIGCATAFEAVNRFSAGAAGAAAAAAEETADSLANVNTQKQIARSAVSVVCRKLKEEFRTLKESWMRETSR
jgi:DNA-directed RNA polymerase subunit L